MFKVNDKVKTTQYARDRLGYNVIGIITAIVGDDVIIDYSGIDTGDRKIMLPAKCVEKV